MNRRNFVRGMCAGGIATFAWPQLSLARVPANGQLVFVLLRGGLDGLAAIVPYGDPHYSRVRGAMAYPEADLLPLEKGFGFAPGLHSLKAFWDQKELAIVHSLAIPYRTRSHFDGQAVLETGLGQPKGSSDGWLNRLLQVMGGEATGIAVAAGLPLSLSGEHPVQTWSPAKLGVIDDGYLDRLHLLYRNDSRLLDRFEASLQTPDDPTMNGGMARGPRRIEPIMRAAARFLRDPDGPNVAAMEFSGWDTHANQGTKGGQLDRLLGQLAEGLAAFKTESGSSWKTTTVVVMTEFGRTAHPNGTGGTDHGTAGVGLVLSPCVARSQVVTDWPGLAEQQLYEHRDLRPTIDTRAVLKTAIAACFDLTGSQMNRVFPGADQVKVLANLMT